LQEGLHKQSWRTKMTCLRQYIVMRGLHQHLRRQRTNIYSTKHLYRRVFGRRGFAIILAHYNGSRAFATSASTPMVARTHRQA
jgi:hypothetical protein